MFKSRVSVANGILQKRSQSTYPGNGAAAQYLSKGTGGGGVSKPPQHKETAFADSAMSVGMFGGVQFSTMFRGIIPDNSSDDSQLGTLLRDIWHYDNVGGSAVDLQCGLAFSNWTLIGIDQEIAEIYADALARLDMRIMLPQISRNFLVDGAFIGTLLYDNTTNGFQDVLIHDRFNSTISPQPLFSVDPVVVVNSASNLKQFMSSYSPYAEATLRGYPKKILENFMNGSNVLDPVTTLLALRKGTTDSACVSYLRRLLPMYMLEKTLFRGTLTEASKRQRATTQIMMGTDDWEPTAAEMLEYTQKFQMSDMDPLGAWVATRQGVTLSDIRPAGEIWKWTDSADVLVPYKLRALGISEAFLSSDACMVGDTLIPTDKGLVTIESLGTGKKRNSVQPISVNTVSRYGKGKATAWLYNGFRETTKVTTETGHSIEATGNHPVLVLRNGETVWIRVDKLQLGDVLCTSPTKLVRTTPLDITVEPWVPKIKEFNKNGSRVGCSPGSRTETKFKKFPTKMTPKLAYWIALYISEGYGTVNACFANSDNKLVSRFAQLGSELFGVDLPNIYVKYAEEYEEKIIYGLPTRATKDYYSTRFCSIVLMDWLRKIGVSVKTTAECGGVDLPSRHKVVPWSVLQADEESQLAFLAGYAECDGAINSSATGRCAGTTWISMSEKLVTQIRAMLNSHGFSPRGSPAELRPKGVQSQAAKVKLGSVDSNRFWEKASKYLSSKTYVPESNAFEKLAGLPASYWLDKVKASRVGKNRHGAIFKLQDGTEYQWANKVTTAGHKGDTDRRTNLHVTNFSYLEYKAGRYDNLMVLLKKLMPEDHVKLVALLRLEYVYTRVTSLEYKGKQHVYDISMKEGTEPAFVANGLIVHNTYANAEASLTMFMDNLDSYREFMTHKLFYSKLFPLIAITHNLYKDANEVKDRGTLDSLMYNMRNTKNLKMPTFQWTKNLKTPNSAALMENLDKLSEKGFPVGLKTWAAAANIDLSASLFDLEQDKKIRDQIAKIMGTDPSKAPGAPGAGQATGEDGTSEEAAMSLDAFRRRIDSYPMKSALRTPTPSILDREFGGDFKYNKAGKPVPASASESKMANDRILKAVKALSDPHRFAEVKKQLVAKHGKVPKVGW